MIHNLWNAICLKDFYKLCYSDLELQAYIMAYDKYLINRLCNDFNKIVIEFL